MAVQIITDFTKVELVVNDIPKIKVNQWEYFNPLDSSLHKLGSKDIIVPFFGYGKYSVDVWLEDQLQQISKEFIKHGSVLVADTRVVNTLPEHDLIGKWMWHRLPKTEYNNVIKLYENRDVDGLMTIHNNYKLSRYTYCCGTKSTILNWFGDAIKNGTIKRQAD